MTELIHPRFKMGLYIGRFQPFHKGHLEAVKDLVEKVQELYIVVGSAQRSHEPNNPFSAGERITMIRIALNEAGVDPKRYLTVTVPDVDPHTMWVSQVVAYTPKFDIVFSNDPLTLLLFEEAGVRTEPIPTYRRDVFSSAEFRKRVIAEENWEDIIPKSVVAYLKEINGIERYRRVLATT